MQTSKQLIERARRTNVKRDALDRCAGFAAPEDCNTSLQLRTVLIALEAGMNMNDWNCVAEAYVMLEATEKRKQDANDKPSN